MNSYIRIFQYSETIGTSPADEAAARIIEQAKADAAARTIEVGGQEDDLPQMRTMMTALHR